MPVFLRIGRRSVPVIHLPEPRQILLHQFRRIGGREEITVLPLRVPEPFLRRGIHFLEVEGLRAGDLVGEAQQG